MARHTGKNLVVMVDNSSGTPTALTHVVAATISYEYEEVGFLGDTEKSSLAGQQMTRVELEYEWDDTATTGNHALLGSIVGDNTNTRSVLVRPVGTGGGLAVFSMEGVLLSYGNPTINREGKLVGTAIFAHHANATDAPAWSTQ
jgi:hypothetical protein